jgi:phosphonate transport system substrate-binding protein
MLFSALPEAVHRVQIYICVFLLQISLAQAAEPLLFGVLNQRSVIATAEIWNPILTYVSNKSGVPLTLRMGSVAEETTVLTVRGDFDFVYTNHLFTPERDKLGFRLVARFDTPGISGQVVVLESSPYLKLSDLSDKRVSFANPDGFTGYWVPMDALLQNHVRVEPVFAGNQESAMTRLVLGSVEAAGVNSRVMAQFARREGLKYRVLWSSEPYMDLAVMAHPRVPAATVDKIRQALIGMASDAEGKQILTIVSKNLEKENMLKFVDAQDHEYDNYRVFYRNTLVKKVSK